VGTRASAHNEYIWVMVEVRRPGLLVPLVVCRVCNESKLPRPARCSGSNTPPRNVSLRALCQVLMVGVLLFALQSEAFHYPLKSWWLVAAFSCNLFEIARTQQASNQQLVSTENRQ